MTLYDDVSTVFIDDPEEHTQDEVIESLQRMISAGQWSLEGHTGRVMAEAIESGHCVLGPERATDYWGNTIPSRHDAAKAGSREGSIAYANNLRRERGDKLITGSYLRRVERGVR